MAVRQIALVAVMIVYSALSPPLLAEGVLVIGDSWAEPVGNQLKVVLVEQGHPEIPVIMTPYWGGPRNLDTPEGFAAISGWLKQWPDVDYLYMMMGQNNWLCCWTSDMIGSAAETTLFASIIDHTENVVDHIQSIRPEIKILWTAGEYLRPHHLGTPSQMNANYDRLQSLALEFVKERGPLLTFLNWNGLFQLHYGFDGIKHSEFDPAFVIPPGDPSLPDPALPSPQAAFPVNTPAHPTQSGYKVMAQALYDRYFSSELDQQNFEINAGLNDAWYNPDTSGQGFLISVFPEIGQVFLAWFTFEVERPDGSIVAQLGEPGHRWLTAQGAYAGNQAVLDIWVSEGGIFDSGQPAPMLRQDGEIVLEFNDCDSGTVSYNIPSIGKQGSIPIERVVLDNVPLCESL